MKKIFILLLALVSFSVSGQVISEFETGYKSYRNRLITYESNRFHLNSFYSKFYVGYKYKQFKAMTETSIFFDKAKKLHEFSPKQSEFIFSLSYQFKNISFEYSHLCGHPIINKMTDFNNGRIFFESYDKFSIKVSIR